MIRCAYCVALPAAGQSFGLSLGYRACPSCAQLPDDVDGYLTDSYLSMFDETAVPSVVVN